MAFMECYNAQPVFQSLSGLTLGLNCLHSRVSEARKYVSIPFRADTGFELDMLRGQEMTMDLFQSLSGLTLGLNS